MPDQADGVVYAEIDGYPGYGVSSDGHVWTRRGKGYPRRQGGFMPNATRLIPHAQSSGHLAVTLTRADGKRLVLRVHRLILTAFVGPCPDGMECCHNDGDPANNHVDNLRWDTHARNHADRFCHGQIIVGDRHPHTKLSDDDVRCIRRLRSGGMKLTDIALRFGVSFQTVSSIATGRKRQHVAEEKL